MPDTRAEQGGATYRYYAFWFFERPTCFWPEAALRLRSGERAEDYVGHLGPPREITRERFYEFPSGARNTRQPKRTPQV